MLTLWTQVGGAIGSAVSAAVWDAQVPANLAKYVPSLTADEITAIFGDITVAQTAEPRAQIIEAYNETYRMLSLPALILVFVPLICACFTTNYVLDSRHNAVEDTKVNPKEEEIVKQQIEAREHNPLASTA